MWLPKRKIPCYVLVYEQVDIVRKTMDFLIGYADRLDIIVLENPSQNSPEIGEYIHTLGASKLIKKHYLFAANVTGSAFDTVLNDELAYIRKCPYVLITDGDITTTDTGWLDEEISILRSNPDVFACGISLDKSNLPLRTFPDAGGWIPEDVHEFTDHYEVFTGAHLLLLRGKELAGFMHWKNSQNLPFVDGTMHRYCSQQLHAKWARTKKSAGYHLTWDLYHDLNHPYTKFKLAKSFRDTWYHDKTTNYKLTTF